MSPNRPWTFPLLLLCFTLSGAAGLIYQTAWSQQLAHVFGASEMAVATVLAAYMGGLALGAALAGRYFKRPRRPVLLYGLLELGIAVAALAVPVALQWANRLQVHLLARPDMLDDSATSSSTLFYLAASFAILLPPTAMMGATLPLLARRVVSRDAQIAPRIGALYAANTGGAALGTLISAFVLLPRLGLDHTVWVAVALNFAVFLAAMAMERQAPETRRTETPEIDPAPLSGTPKWHGILPVMAVSGAVSFTYEIVWTRLLTHLLGGSIYAFGTMLATFLIGLALGAALASRLGRRPRQARRVFAVAQMAIAACAWGAFGALDSLPRWSGRWNTWWSGSAGALHGDSWLAAATLLPGAVAIGATFPLAVRILARSADDTAVASARIFSWNTVGAILGAVGSGFFVLPALGYGRTVQLCVAASLLLAGWATRGRHGHRFLRRATTIALLAVTLWQPPTPWNLLRSSALGAIDGAAEFHAVGRSANVMLLDRGDGWRLTTNGLPEALILPPGARLGELPIARWLTHLPFVARPEAESLLVVGLGGGSALEEIPETVRELHVVELEPRVVDANRRLGGRRRVDPLADPRLRLHLDDARSALRLAQRSFDAIVSQPSHPWTAGASHLFTQEFFRQVADSLDEDGVFVQWIGLAFVDVELLHSVVATLQSVFPYVEVYVPEGQALLFMASKRPLEVSTHAPRALADSRRVWSALGVHHPADLFAHRLLGPRAARHLAAEAPIIRDGHNILQTRSPRLGDQRLSRRQLDTVFAEVDGLEGLDEVLSPADRLRAAWRLARGAFPRRAATVLESLPPGPQRTGGEALLAFSRGQQRDAEQILRSQVRPDAAPPHLDEAVLFAHLQIYRRDLAAGRSINVLKHWDGSAEQTVAAAWPLAQNRRWQALAALDAALAGIEPEHLLFPDAARLRCQWRVGLGKWGPGRHRPLDFLDGALAVHPTASDLVLRARAAHLEGRTDALRATLFELLRGIEQRRYDTRHLTALQDLVTTFANIASEDEAPRLEILRRRLEVLKAQ